MASRNVKESAVDHQELKTRLKKAGEKIELLRGYL